MSTSPEQDLDLEILFLPAWAQEPSSARLYAKYEGGPERPERRDSRRGPRPPRRDRSPGERRKDERPQGDYSRGPRPDGARGKPSSGVRPGFRRGEPRERREPQIPLPELNVNLVPDE